MLTDDKSVLIFLQTLPGNRSLNSFPQLEELALRHGLRVTPEQLQKLFRTLWNFRALKLGVLK
jgi:hypothetical protein